MKYLLALAGALMAAGPLLTAEVRAGTPAALVDADIALQQLRAGTSRLTADARVTLPLLLQRGLAAASRNLALEAKHDRLAGDLAGALNAPPVDNRSPATVPPVATELQSDRTPSCPAAPALTLDRPVRAMLDAGGELWLRLPAAGKDGRGLSTLGSTLDAELAWFGHCTGAAVTVSDDALGLQALLPWPADTGGLLRIRNLGEAGQLLLQPTAVATVRGTITEQGAGTPLSGIEVRGYQDLSWSIGSGYSNAAGQYTITVELGAAAQMPLFLRTFQSFGGTLAYANEGYQNVVCDEMSGSWGLASCDPQQLDVVQANAGSTVSGIDFALARTSRLIVRIGSAGSATVPPNAVASLYSGSNGSFGTYADAAGRVVFEGVGPQPVRVLMRGDGHLGEVYDNIPCEFSSCVPLGQALTLEPGTTRQILAELTPIGSGGGGPMVRVRVPGDTSPYVDAELRIYHPNGLLATSQYAYDGNFQSFGNLPAGQYYFAASSRGGRPQLHAGVPCSQIGCLAELGSGTLESLPLSQSLEFTLQPKPVIRGTIRAGDGTPLAGVRVLALAASGSLVASAYADSSGSYRIGELPAGNYRLTTESSAAIDETWPDSPCDPPFLTAGCDAGTLLMLSDANITADFILAPSGRIRGRITNAPMFTGNAQVIDAAGTALLFGSSTAEGYVLEDLPPGNWRIAVYRNTYFPQLAGGVRCSYGSDFTPFSLCPAGGEITVTSGGTVEDVDFTLMPRGLRVRVRDARTLAALPGIAVDLWEAGTTLARSSVSDAAGLAVLPVASGFVRLSTDNVQGYLDEVYNNIACPNGSAFIGRCDLAAGSNIDVQPWQTNPTIAPLDIELEPGPTADPIFRSSFD